jgi:membrane associated rhomboid family serine protease
VILPYDDDQPKTWISPVTHGLIAVNVLVSLLVLTRADPGKTLLAWAFHPDHPTPLTWLSSLFLHAGPMHLIGNMLFLHIAGRSLEFKLGPARFAGLYFAGGLVAAIVQAMASPLPCLGASGAISGLFSAYVLLLPWGSVKLFYWFGLFWAGTWEVSAIWLLLYFVGEQLLYLGLFGSTTGVGFAAHLGGVGGGLVTALVLSKFLPADELARTARLERAPEVGTRRVRLAAPKTQAPTEAQLKAAERAEARLAIEHALGQKDGAKAARLYGQAELLSGFPVLAPGAQETLARTLIDGRELRLAHRALTDLVRVHAGTREAFRAAELLARFRRAPAAAGA